jgi:TetR/AcrR family transcriptional regulator, transcriptional repressor for nem operon
MKKGEATRRHIVASTARLLNSQGYLSTPVSEIMQAAGLQKGGIYRHFESRAALTREAFEYAFACMRDRLVESIQGKTTATDKLLAILEIARGALKDAAYRGGCPIMNLAIETDDAEPELRKLAREAMARFIALMERMIREGIEQDEFAAGDARARATVMVASIEGGIMLGNLYKDQSYMDAVVDALRRDVSAGFR